MTTNRMSWLDRLIRLSLNHPLLVLTLAGLLLVAGSVWIADMPVEIFPDLSAPTVTVVTEAPGMAPEEVELLVTFPLESALGGAADLRRLRSVSADGISVIWAEFDWGVDIYHARQVIAERLGRVEMPARVERPELGPISSILGEITFLALTADPEAEEPVSPMELRRLSEVLVRRNLLALPGISRVVAIGGQVREVRVEVDPQALIRHRVSVDEVIHAVEEASRSAAAGFHVEGGQEYRVRGLGRARGPEDLGHALIRHAGDEGDTPIRVEDVARVEYGPEPARGTAAYSTRPAVVLSVQKQPDANTLEVTEDIDALLVRLAPSLPEGVQIETENFRQADFIEVAIHNVTEALRDGAILVVLVLILFLGNWRATLISALAIPLSLAAGILTVSAFGGTLNTMTLGGLAIAIGALVDDAIIDVENVVRRLRLERTLPEETRRKPLEIVFQGSSEVRKAIVFATLLIALVFLPLFFLPGLEGRLLAPLGFAYVAALAASLLVSVTVTPVLCLLLLARTGSLGAEDAWLMRRLRRAYRPILDRSLRHPKAVVILATVLLVAALALVPTLARSFLPPFNEGSLTVSVVSAPGIPLAESDRLGRQVEEILLSYPEVVSTSRRTGRAEKDEHVQGVNASEIEVVLHDLSQMEGARSKEDLVANLRRDVSVVPGTVVSFGQPISHRIDHMISGSRTNLAVKVFGPDPTVLRGLASRIRDVLATVPGIVDLSNQEQATSPQLVIDFDRRALARRGLSAAELTETVEALFQGTEAGEIVSDAGRGLVERVVVRYPESLRDTPEAVGDLPVTTPEGRMLSLDQVAEVRYDLGPSLLRRENVQRVAMVTANVAGVDLAGVVERAQDAVDEAIDLPPGYVVTFGGQFEEAARSVRHLTLLAVLIFVAMYALLYAAFRGHRETLVVLVNLPLALVGGVFAVALGDGVLSVATLVGFVTLFGIATRNGVLLVTHYQHLVDDEGLDFREAVFRGSVERLAPILMTALTAGLALVPLVLAGGEPGNEIQSPMARVILGGLVTSTFLNLVVVPALYRSWVQIHDTMQGQGDRV